MVRQLLTESVLFALLGGALGLLFARWSVGLLVALAPVQLPSFVDVTLNGTVLVFTAAISVATGVAFGLFPAFGSTQTKPGEFLKEATRTLGAGLQRRSVRGILVVAEVSLAVLLLVSAALMLKSFQKMHRFDPGFDSEALLTMRFDLVEESSGIETTGRLKEIVERAASLPGVESASLSSHIFYGRGYMTTAVSVEGYVPPEPDQDVLSYVQYVGPEFFRTLRIPLLQGRAFTSGDEGDAPPVVIINESFARELWPDQNAIGKRLVMGAFALLALCLAVVGVFGVMSYSVSRAAHEIGIRVALGAQSRDVLGLFMKRAVILVAVGLALGLGASFAATRFLTGILYEVSPLDGSVFVLISVALALIVGLASYLPARRASRLDPLAALRYE